MPTPHETMSFCYSPFPKTAAAIYALWTVAAIVGARSTPCAVVLFIIFDAFVVIIICNKNKQLRRLRTRGLLISYFLPANKVFLVAAGGRSSTSPTSR